MSRQRAATRCADLAVREVQLCCRKGRSGWSYVREDSGAAQEW